VIVRLMGGGGQYRVDDSLLERLNELDDHAVAALERNDEAELDARLDEMADLVQSQGEPLPEDDLAASDVVIPPSDLTLEETRRLLSEDGLIPDLPAAN
jgi:PspA-Associated protein